MNKLVIILIAFALFVACKKDKGDDLSIKGKWTGVNIIENTYENDVLTDSDTESILGITFDFQENGLVVVADSSGTESYPYTIKSPTQMYMDGQLANIENLTNSTVTLSFREVWSPTIYSDVSMNLKR